MRELFGHGTHVRAAGFGAGESELARQKSRVSTLLGNFFAAPGHPGVARCNGPGFLLEGAEQGCGRRGATVSAEHGIDKTFPIKGKI